MTKREHKVCENFIRSFMSYYIVMFENGVSEPFYLASWDGDPGRTLLKVNAKVFRTPAGANKALKKAIRDNPHRKLVGKVIEYNPLKRDK